MVEIIVTGILREFLVSFPWAAVTIIIGVPQESRQPPAKEIDSMFEVVHKGAER